jgi:O-succinylbenzoate synthase
VHLPRVADLIAAAHVVRVPLRTRFRGVTEREALLLHGPAGWGEFAPFVEYGDDEAARWLAAALDAAWGDPADGGPAVRPVPVRDAVPVNATVPAVRAAEVAGLLVRFDGCTTAKVKVAQRGQSLADDVARVAAVREFLGPNGKIRVDANGGWSVDDAVRALAALVPYDLEYAEQPCAGLDGLRAVRTALARAHLDVRVAADESVRRVADPLRAAASGAADIVVVKVAPLGGVAAALEVAGTLRADHDVPVVVSSALDTSVGIAAGVALAAALPDLPFACGLGTVTLLADDVAARPLVARRGVIGVAEAAALVPDTDRLGALAAPADRRDWWLARLARCARLLSRPGVPARAGGAR